ncbi:hypothetical protein D3C72_1487130 [compost metagenome]
MPEARVGGDQLVIGLVDEHAQRDVAPVGLQLVGHHLAHLHAPVVDRRTDVERAQLGRAQHELLAGCVGGHHRRHFQPFEFARGLAGLAGIDADIGARQQRLQPRHAAGGEARAHHPEARVGHGEVLGVLGQVDRRDHMRTVAREPHRLDQADIDVLVAHRGLARRQAFRGAEADGDLRPARGQCVHQQRHADDRRDDRDQPHQRRQPARAAAALGPRQAGCASGIGRMLFSVGHCRLPANPTAGADRS